LTLLSFGYGQERTLKGQVIANEDVDGIHILNKTALKFTITDVDGSFEIIAREGDTLTISSLRYLLEERLVDKRIFEQGTIVVPLTEKINELDEVVVGKILTGSLSSDIENVKMDTEINFYDLGIPGYTGKMPTQSERRLIEATSGGGFIPLNPILNWISGRTKRLKKNIVFEANETCLRQFRDDYEKVLFEKESLEDSLKAEYFYFCTESEGFKELCDLKDPIKMINFFREKLTVFKANVEQRNQSNEPLIYKPKKIDNKN
jgi:hypothetical protein